MARSVILGISVVAMVLSCSSVLAVKADSAPRLSKTTGQAVDAAGTTGGKAAQTLPEMVKMLDLNVVLDDQFLKNDPRIRRSDALSIAGATGFVACPHLIGQGTLVVTDDLVVIPLHLVKDHTTGSDPTAGASDGNSQCQFQTLLRPDSPTEFLLGDGNAGIGQAIAAGNLAIIRSRDLAVVRLKKQIPGGRALEVPSEDIAMRACKGVIYDYPSDVPPPQPNEKNCVSYLLSIAVHHGNGPQTNFPMVQTTPVLWVKHRGEGGTIRNNLKTIPGDSGGLDLGRFAPNGDLLRSPWDGRPIAVGMLTGRGYLPFDGPFDPQYRYAEHELLGPEILAAAKAMDALHHQQNGNDKQTRE
jgi:hypothetical protein